MAAQLPPLHRVSDDDHGAHVIVSAYSWASIVAVAAAARLLLALNRKLPWGLDDLSFAIAVLLAIASSVLYHLAVNAGLGRHASALDDGGITNYFKRMYAAHLFGVAAIGCGKLSSVHTSARAIVFEPRIYHVMLGIAAAWTVFSLFVTAFQCNPPSSWEFTPSNCPTKGYLQYAVSVLNIITDIIIAASVIPTVWKLRMPKDQRITVLVLFTLRFVIPCVVIGQIVILANTLRSSDQPWDGVNRAIIDQAVIGLSVILATLPRLNRVFYSFKDGLLCPEISDFEQGHYNSKSSESRRGRSKPKLTSPTSTKATSTTITGNGSDGMLNSQKSNLAVGSQEDEDSTKSSLGGWTTR